MAQPATTRGRPKGSKTDPRLKPWTDAIRRAMLRGDNLNKLAEALLAKALEGDISAIKEIGDRTEGKALQAIEAKVDASVVVEVVRFADSAP